MSIDNFDYDPFFGDLESVETLSNSTISPHLTEFDFDSGIANTPTLPVGLDDMVINLDDVLSSDPNGEFKDFSNFFNENGSTYENLFSAEPPPPSNEIRPIINCVKVPSFTNVATTGTKCIKIQPIDLNKNIKIVKFSNAIPSKPVKRRRSESPKEEKKILTLEQLKLQYGNLNEDALKKHLRMIKNRESASLSRKRRKELMDNLDTKVKKLTDENEGLKKENSKLLTRINTLEIENELLKKYKILPTGKSVVLMGVILLAVFNIFTIKSFVPNKNNSIATFNENHGAVVPSRTILSQKNENFYSNGNDYGDYEIFNNSSSVIPTYPYIQCVAFINKTHSQRINQDLRSWVEDDSEKQQETKPVVIPDPTSITVSSNSVVQPTVHISRKVARNLKFQSETKGQLQRIDSNYDDFVRTIDRKNDTLYFISFKRDHLILPATIQNQTQRPKLSLILPASMTNLNKSIRIPTNHVPMIKIDCEVEDTKLVFIKRGHVPSSYQNDLFQYYSSVPQASI